MIFYTVISTNEEEKPLKVITKMELQPDMVLGEDIQDQNHVIYPAGTTVTTQIIEKL